MAGQTIAEKIISQHAGRETFADDLVIVDVDGALASDTTAPLAIKAFREMGGVKPWDPRRTFLVIDHASPAPNEQVGELHAMMRAFALQTGATLYDVGEGICHQLMIEHEHVKAGDIFIGADSHTCTYGCLGAFAAGVGSTDLAAVLLTGKTWLKVPASIRIEITGSLASGVLAKDLALAIVGEIGMAGATYQAVEFCGDCVEGLTLNSRMTLANMAIEMGAKTGIVHPAGLDVPKDGDIEGILPDGDARYERVVSFDASGLGPKVSMPHEPDNVVDIDHVVGTKIDYGFIGTCVNGRLDDLQVAAKILRGKRIAPGVRLLIAPASRHVFLDAVRDGTVAALTEAGATFLPSGCGPCVGTHNGVPGKGETVISTGNRNFRGRMGNPEAHIYLGSPATVAAAAVAGEIVPLGEASNG